MEWLGELLGQYEGRHIKPVSNARIVPETRHHPVAPPRPNSLLGLVKPYEWCLLIRADNAAAYTPRSYGESMAERMDIMERLIQAVSNMSGVHTDYIAELFDFCLHKTNFDFWAAVRKFAEYHA